MAINKSNADEVSYTLTPKRKPVKANLESLSGTLFPTDVLANGATDMFVDSASSGIVGSAVYVAALRICHHIPALRAGQITRAEVLTDAWNQVRAHCHNNALAILSIAVVLAFCPFLMPVAGVLGIGGVGVMVFKLGKALMHGLDDEAKAAIENAADQLARINDPEDDTDAAPQPA